MSRSRDFAAEKIAKKKAEKQALALELFEAVFSDPEDFDCARRVLEKNSRVIGVGIKVPLHLQSKLVMLYPGDFPESVTFSSVLSLARYSWNNDAEEGLEKFSVGMTGFLEEAWGIWVRGKPGSDSEEFYSDAGRSREASEDEAGYGAGSGAGLFREPRGREVSSGPGRPRSRSRSPGRGADW